MNNQKNDAPKKTAKKQYYKAPKNKKKKRKKGRFLNVKILCSKGGFNTWNLSVLA